ncbi:hypothetical protein AVEN_75693-1 [Araneus ventricosus]|uniref:Uncharacterized protein n=1 Tax=Araneus ventricosus TaxID=182803 RepID=A0A4Y2VA36_ARAVE|nr:hypothetical protein AVEN_46063-1 [Araneus ventricosus]GBO21382.1 hypothetical protein AVEN_75693-1 [Araneus ventricosus]
MTKSSEISADRRHRINEDRKDGVSYENPAKMCNSSKLGICFLRDSRYPRNMRLRDPSKEREGEANTTNENKCKIRFLERKIDTEKERFTNERDRGRLEIECISSNSLP